MSLTVFYRAPRWAARRIQAELRRWHHHFSRYAPLEAGGARGRAKEARGQVHVEYPDGCTEEFQAPQVITIHPEHDAWVVGDDPAVLIEVDFEAETPQLFGLNGHRHRT